MYRNYYRSHACVVRTADHRFHDLNDTYTYIRRFNIQSPFNGDARVLVIRDP